MSHETTPDDGGVAYWRLKCLTQRFVPDQLLKLLSLFTVALSTKEHQRKLN